MLTTRQMEIVTGSLLGDGTIWTNFVDLNMKLQLSQSKLDLKAEDKKSYMCWFAKEFIDLGVSLRSHTKKAAGIILSCSTKTSFDVYTFYTRRSSLWAEIESAWYVPRTDHPRFKRRKIVPTDIRLTPLTLCVWYMDDGCNNAKDANIELNTQGFSKEDVDLLIERLKEDLGIESWVKKDREKLKIFVGRTSYFDFIEIIKAHVEWSCFSYKLDTTAYSKIPHKGETHSNAKLTEKDIREIFRLRENGMTQKELANRFKVSNISEILSGNQWSHLGLSLPRTLKPRITDEQKNIIVDMYSVGKSQKEIALELGIDQSSVSRILKNFL